MTAFQISIVLVAAILHASWNIASKYGASAGYVFVFAYEIVSCVFYLPWVIYLFSVANIDLNIKVIIFLTLAALLHLLYNLALIRGYQKASLSVVYPVARGTGPLITSIIAIIVFNESLNAIESLGILIICAGVLLIAARDGLANLVFNNDSWVGIRWGVFIGCIIAGYSIIDAYIVKILLIAPVIVGWVSSLGGLFILFPKVIANRKTINIQMKNKWWYAVFVGIVSPLAYILILYVLQSGANVSIVAPLRESSMVFATIAAVMLFKERVPFLGWLGCISILGGVLAVAY